MSPKTSSNMVSLIYKPLCVVLLLVGLFGLIRLRSGVVKVAYDLRNLEEKRMEALKERKLLLAERANLMSIEKLGASFKSGDAGKKFAGGGYVFPDRTRVVHIKTGKGPETYRASFEVKEEK